MKDLSPCGEIRVEGFIWKACTKGEKIKKGEEVIVVSYEGLSLIVERAQKDK
ncbi:MAG: NfeD family protein [TACK group archaeon]|nr:NfeD family protein [TACK group archaeon]